jgi:hypothetical protein
MATTQEVWYVRLPDGRVIRSRNTVSLRYHVRRGRIPPGSQVRRSPGDAWQALAEVEELADAVQSAAARRQNFNGRMTTPALIRSRAQFQEKRLLGVRGLVGELLDALDSSLHRVKLGVACLLGMLGAVGWITWHLLPAELEGSWWTVGATAWAVLLLLVACLGISFVSKFTALEVARMRQPRAGELWPSVLGHAVRLAAALLLVVGTGAALFLFLRWLPAWMLAQASPENGWWEWAANATLILRLILEVIFWPVIALAPLLISPILVVQECTFLSGIRQWWRLLRQHLGRIFLYESFATMLGALFTVPLLVTVALAYWSLGSSPPIVGQATIYVLEGIALTPLIAYLLVANVFIYLNLRYEYFHSAR